LTHTEKHAYSIGEERKVTKSAMKRAIFQIWAIREGSVCDIKKNEKECARVASMWWQDTKRKNGGRNLGQEGKT
jgi:hypothetical protein